MRKVIAAFNMTLDGYCDHTESVADEELHQHYTDLLRGGDSILYGRTTYQLMEAYWPTLVKHPSGEKSMDDFAQAIENIEKIVFSRTLKKVSWESARLATLTPKEEVLKLRKENGKPVFVGSRSLIVELLNEELLDELQVCIHPIIAGKGLQLFNPVKRKDLRLIGSKDFRSGCKLLRYAFGGRGQ